MTPPTPEELLRLARKAWPDTTLSVEFADDGTVYVHEVTALEGYFIDTLFMLEASDNARAALHAALLVLAGEVDLQALLDARTDDIQFNIGLQVVVVRLQASRIDEQFLRSRLAGKR